MSGFVVAACAALVLVLAARRLREAWSASWIVRAALRRGTTALRALRDVPIETRGRLRPEGPVVASRAERCALLLEEVTSHWTTRGAKGQTNHHHHVASFTRRAPTVLLEDEGAVAELDVVAAVFSGSSRETTFDREAFLARFPRLASAVDARARTVVLREEWLEEGEDVRVWAAGVAGLGGGRGGYRGAPATTPMLHGDAKRGLVVAKASEAALVRRALPPAVGLFAVGAATLAYAAWLAYLLYAGWIAP